MIRLLSSKQSCLATNISRASKTTNVPHQIQYLLTRRHLASSSARSEDVYKSMGLNDAKYPEQEMTEILRRVSKIEGPEIERRRIWNFVRNTCILVGIFVTPWIFIASSIIYWCKLCEEIPDDLD